MSDLPTLVTAASKGSPLTSAEADADLTALLNALTANKVTAAGDMLYASALNVLARLAKGTASQKLVMASDASLPGWATGIKAMTFTRDMSLASGAQSITGVGFQPNAVIVFAVVDGGVKKTSWGFSSASTNYTLINKSNYSDGVYEYAVQLVRIWTGVSDYYTGNNGGFTTDGMSINWTKNGTPTGTVTCLALFFV